jgi:hypothetical protein
MNAPDTADGIRELWAKLLAVSGGTAGTRDTGRDLLSQILQALQ